MSSHRVVIDVPKGVREITAKFAFEGKPEGEFVASLGDATCGTHPTALYCRYGRLDTDFAGTGLMGLWITIFFGEDVPIAGGGVAVHVICPGPVTWLKKQP